MPNLALHVHMRCCYFVHLPPDTGFKLYVVSTLLPMMYEGVTKKIIFRPSGYFTILHQVKSLP